MIKHACILSLMVLSISVVSVLNAQTIVRRAVACSAGEGMSENIQLTWTLGEANASHQSFLLGTGFLTTGFHQPDFTDRLEAGEHLLAIVVQNPFSSTLQSYLYAPSGTVLTMYLFDAQGKLVATKGNVHSGAVQWSLENLPSGTYFLGMGTQGKGVEYTRKVIKVH